MTDRAKLTFENKVFDITTNWKEHSLNNKLADVKRLSLEVVLDKRTGASLIVDDNLFNTFTSVLSKSLNYLRNRFKDSENLKHYVQIRLKFAGLKKSNLGENFSGLHSQAAEEQIFYLNNSLFQVAVSEDFQISNRLEIEFIVIPVLSKNNHGCNNE